LESSFGPPSLWKERGKKKEEKKREKKKKKILQKAFFKTH